MNTIELAPEPIGPTFTASDIMLRAGFDVIAARNGGGDALHTANLRPALAGLRTDVAGADPSTRTIVQALLRERLRDLGWSADEARLIARETTAGRMAAVPDSGGPRWYSDTELTELPAMADLVAGHIPEAAIVLFYGPSGHGKTFIGLDLSQSVGTGLAWHGHVVQQGPVAYVAAEGRRGLAQRVEAWKGFHEWSGGTNVQYLPQPVHVLEPVEMAAFTASLQSWEVAPRLVVLDTLAWCITPGDENSTRDMTAFVAAVGEIRATLGASVLILHHTGHDKTRERGNTALAAAADTVAQVKEEGGRVVLTCTKQRESVPFGPIRFRFAAFAGSVVPQRAIEDGADDGLTAKEQEALEALQSIYVEGEGVSSTRWDETAGMSRATFYRARRRLTDLNFVRVDNSKHFVVSNRVVSPSHDVPF